MDEGLNKAYSTNPPVKEVVATLGDTQELVDGKACPAPQIERNHVHNEERGRPLSKFFH